MNDLIMADLLDTLQGIREELKQIASSTKAIDRYFKYLTKADELVQILKDELEDA